MAHRPARAYFRLEIGCHGNGLGFIGGIRFNYNDQIGINAISTSGMSCSIDNKGLLTIAPSTTPYSWYIAVTRLVID